MKPSSVIAQTYQNVHAVLAYYRLPEPHVIATLSDRVMFVRLHDFEDRMDWLVTVGQWERWDFVQNHGVTALSGWRERVASYSTQVILHQKAIEIDCDVWNPNFGAGPAFLHMCECLIPGKTDPFKVARGLRARGIEVKDVKEDA